MSRSHPRIARPASYEEMPPPRTRRHQPPPSYPSAISYHPAPSRRVGPSSTRPDSIPKSSSLSKIDSGYAEVSHPDRDGDGHRDGATSAADAGAKVLEGWSALKKAVAGFAGGEGGGEATHGQEIWNRLTKTLAASVGTAHDAWNAQDDATVGPDGETKLSRAIKSYHLSRVESAQDVPEWLLTDAERARYGSRKLAHARSSPDFEVADRPVPRQYQYHSEEPSRGSAADRLARMREERKMRAVNAI